MATSRALGENSDSVLILLLAAFDLRVEKHVRCALAQALAIYPNVLLQRLADEAIAVDIKTRVACARGAELFGLVGLLLASHVDGRAAGQRATGTLPAIDHSASFLYPSVVGY